MGELKFKQQGREEQAQADESAVRKFDQFIRQNDSLVTSVCII